MKHMKRMEHMGSKGKPKGKRRTKSLGSVYKKSGYKAILQVGQPGSEDTGLCVTDRFFIPQKQPGANSLLWAFFDCVLLWCVVCGLLLLTVTGFSLRGISWVFGAAALECAAMVFLFRSRRCQKYGKALLLLGIFLLALLLFLFQKPFLQGAQRLGYQVILRMNEVYSGELQGGSGGGKMTDVGIFLVLVLIPVIFWLAFSVLKKNQFAYACLFLFPFLTIVALLGGAVSAAALFLVFFGVILCLAYQYPVQRNRMMGGKNRALLEQNQRRYERIRKKSAVLVLAGSIVISVLGFYLIRPMLAFSLAPAERAAVQVQNVILGRVISLLPDVTGGAYSLQVETVGGGVTDGALGDTEGFTFQEIEDLKVTLSAKPTERIYLKGYVGSVYEGSRWKAPYESTFDGAAINWNTDGNPRLYIQNLPFLRTAYVLRQAGEEQEDPADGTADTGTAAGGRQVPQPVQMTVERINANGAYTYVPYGAYLNDYYEVQAGDGAVAGQTAQADQYLLYPWEDAGSLLREWNLREDTANVLDRVEESYEAFCRNQYLEVADGLSQLTELTEEVQKAQKWTPEENLADITSWIRSYLAEHYEYDRNVEPLSGEGDFLTDFLFEKKRGYSIHFASAAVELYRMFGVPARYVVGYEASEALFAAQADGTYTATLEDDDSQAWAEIYAKGIGWQPQDMTPGIIGTLEEVGAGGQRISRYKDGEEEAPGEEEASREEEPSASRLPDAETAVSVADWSVGQIIEGLLGLLAAAFVLGAGAVFGRKQYLNLGFDVFGRRGTEKAALGIFRGIYRRMCFLGLPKKSESGSGGNGASRLNSGRGVHEDVHENVHEDFHGDPETDSPVDSESEEFWSFAERQMQRNKKYKAGELRKMADKLYACCFGGEALSGEDVAKLRQLYRQMPHFPKGRRRKKGSH